MKRREETLMSTETQTAIGKFVWHDHQSRDAEKAKSFYAELLGWELEAFDPDGMNYSMIKVDDKMHGGFGEAAEGSPPHWLGHVFVESADDTAEKVKSAGGTIYYGPANIPEVGRFVVFADPQGAVVSAFASAGEPEGPPAEGVFAWDELATSDVGAAKSFYGDVFGWTSRDMDMGGGMTYSIFERPGGGDAGGCMPLTEDMKSHGVPPNWLTYIGTEDVDASADKAKELGATVHMPPTDIPNVGRFAVLMDPTGAAFALFKGNPQD
jgi:predicted enzyme related to lactoylglutathione lyase